MTEQSMTANTTSMVGRTQSFAAQAPYQPSRRALAARSWSKVRRLSGDDYRAALAQHFEAFPPSIGSSCRP
jgi:hypothetical protein